MRLIFLKSPLFFPLSSLEEHRQSIFLHEREKDNYREGNKFRVLVRSNNVGALGQGRGGQKLGWAQGRQPETIRRVQWVVTLRASSRARVVGRGVGWQPAAPLLFLDFSAERERDRGGENTHRDKYIDVYDEKVVASPNIPLV